MEFDKHILAEAMHAAECEQTTICIRTRSAIKTAWAADGYNRRLWLKRAVSVIEWYNTIKSEASPK